MPPYSPHLNPIEYICKTIKRELSPQFIKTKEKLQEIIEKNFKKCVKSSSYAKKWVKKFLKEVKKDK